MYARAPHSAETFPSYAMSDIEEDFASEDLYPGEPASPLYVKGAHVVSYGQLILLLLLAVASGFASDVDTRLEWISRFERVFAAAMQPTPVPSVAKDIATVPTAPPAATAIFDAHTSTSTSAADVSAPLPEVTITSAPGDTDDSVSTPAKTIDSDAYAPPKASNDPYRKRAETVGLNPELSRVILAKLTTTDYRNAAFAIRKAVTTIPDDADFTWPRSRRIGAAVFNIHFVEGAGRDCRRYVVTVTKDRWTTTAPPMEKCGVKIADRSAAKEKTIE